MLQQIKALAAQYKQDFIGIRQHLHANPELSYEEFETSAFIQTTLTNWGIPFKVLANTGVVGIIEGNNPISKVIALRADMDALPITEQNDVPYKSTKPGVMHACGHDVHTTCLLGAAKILNETKQHWSGTVKLIFQLGEEKNPGGASLMIKEGVLDNPAPSKIFALHVHPGMEVGTFSFRGGMVMASADEIYITIKAKGGHAAAPQFTADPILIASQLVVSLQQIVSRQNDPFNPTVLSITAFNAGNTTNVIPSEVKLMGTFRAMNEDWRFKAHDLIKQQAKALVESMGATIDITIDVGYPFVKNDVNLSAAAKVLAIDFAGADNVSETELRMGAEDFAYYSQLIPACFFRLGAGNKAKGITNSVHTPVFDVDENCIEQGMGMLAWLAVNN
ncbi:M20 family metallopeptidase [Ferruginibacter yonginensis]|uniref:M20 family metallopeptidase n=1 Tax=Ferruginibacter yonginensis TaxID=1310416 RepID=A0ABV8QTM0_9BACT